MGIIKKILGIEKLEDKIFEINNKPDIKIGDKIFHSKFGKGTVIGYKVNRNRIFSKEILSNNFKVAFDNGYITDGFSDLSKLKIKDCFLSKKELKAIMNALSYTSSKRGDTEANKYDKIYDKIERNIKNYS